MIKLKMTKLKSNVSAVRNKDITWLFPMITFTITLTAFFTAVDYFTSKADLHIRIGESQPHMKMYHVDTMQQFYIDNKLEIPKELNSLFTKKIRILPKDYIDIGAATSPIDIIKALTRGQHLGGYLGHRIKWMKKRLNRYTYKKRIYSVFDNLGSGYRDSSMIKILDNYEKVLSPDEFFPFLCAVIYSRKVLNDFYFRNSGEIDLKDVRITISSPMSRITESRVNTILDFMFFGYMPHKIESKENSVIVSVPKLKIDDSFVVKIASRENQITTNEIYYSYEAQRVWNYRKMVIVGCITLLITVFLRLVFRGER